MTYDDLDGMYLESAEEEYQDIMRRRAVRDEEIRRRRELRARQQRMKVRTTLIAIGLVVVAFISFAVVELVKKVTSDKTQDEQALVYENIEVEDYSEEEISSATEDEGVLSEDDNAVGFSYLGYNATAGNDDTVIHDTHIFGGYSIGKSDASSYIASENMQSTYAVLIDMTDGSVIAQKDGFTRINPASMTKILTVLVAAEHLTEDELDATVTIELDDTDYAYVHDLSAVNWDAGEHVTVRDLFYGTILPSGADAAHALAKYVAGDEETFVEMMNAKVEELGLSGTTHFTNCVGSYDENHYSTCADISMILKAAVENDFCYEVLKAHTYTTTLTGEHPEGIQISNWFLRRIEDKDTHGEVIAAKTGYVNQSGSCASSYMISNSGHPYICTTADAHSSWRCIYDHVDIYTTYVK